MTSPNPDGMSVDVLVVGAGIVGASCAYHLAAGGHRVMLVEARSGYAEASTGLSFASVRAQWADDLNIEMSWRSIQTYRDFESNHGLDIGYRPNGYLLLFPEVAWQDQLQAVERQRAHGVPVDVLDCAAAREITQFDPAGVAGATWGPADGQIDPHAATGAYVALARKHGAVTAFSSPVKAFVVNDDGSWTVRAGTHTVRAQHVVNAAGGWAGEVAGLAGLSVPVVHSRRNVYATAVGALDKFVPMTVDFATGIYLRTEGDRLLFAGARPDQPDGYQTDVDWPWMEGVLELAAERFPWLTELPLDTKACWAGTYENTPDHDAVLGPDPSAPTWINACGLSGHGLMQAPEVGRLVNEQLSSGAMTSIDVSRLSITRFLGAEDASAGVSLVF